LLHRFGSVDEMDLRRKGLETKLAGVVFFIGAAGLAGVAPAGLWLGEGVIRQAAHSAGYEWIAWVFLFAGTITGAAAFRAGGRIFLGWGPAQEDGSAARPKNDEDQETQSGHDSVPLGMIASATALVVLGYVCSFFPGWPTSVLKAAARFQDSTGYAAQVLNGVAPVTLRLPVLSRLSLASGLFSLLAGMLIAFFHLHSVRFRKAAAIFAKPMKLLQGLHSGHIGDYVTFLTFGIAIFGLLCITGLTAVQR
jgi:multicomponent Na+:H+ antiporter subunit D